MLCSQLPLTFSSEVLDSYPESFSPGQKMVLQFGQTFALSHLHADLVLLWCKARAFTVKQKLAPGKRTVYNMHRNNRK